MSHPLLRVTAFLPLVVLLAPRVAFEQSPSDQAAVDSLYPTARLHPEVASDRHSCYQVAAVGTDGSSTRLVAAYTDTEDAVLRILDRNPSGAFDVSYDSPVSLAMGGIDCRIQLRDIDGDGTNDVFVTLTAERGSTGWVFRAVGTSLENVTPLGGTIEDGYSKLKVASLVDLYHDGSLQVATIGAQPDVPGGRVSVLPKVYKFVGPALVVDSPVLLVDSFQVNAASLLNSSVFNLPEGASGSYVLRITNGVRGGQRRATGISVSINDVPLAGTDALTTDTEFLDIPISIPLADENDITVTLSGAQDATALVVIRSTPIG
jgi:hypothetical protein